MAPLIDAATLNWRNASYYRLLLSLYFYVRATKRLDFDQGQNSHAMGQRWTFYQKMMATKK